MLRYQEAVRDIRKFSVGNGLRNFYRKYWTKKGRRTC